MEILKLALLIIWNFVNCKIVKNLKLYKIKNCIGVKKTIESNVSNIMNGTRNIPNVAGIQSC